MLHLKDDGYVFVSNSGIEYELLEGVSIGADKQYTSDIVFIMLLDCDYNVDNNVAGWLFGSSSMFDSEADAKSYEESIRNIVNEFEKRNFTISE